MLFARTLALLPSLLPGLSFAGAGGEVLVSGYDSQAVHRFDIATGAHLGNLGPVPGSQSIQYGPDGRLYVCAEGANEVLRFDASWPSTPTNVFGSGGSRPGSRMGSTPSRCPALRPVGRSCSRSEPSTHPSTSVSARTSS